MCATAPGAARALRNRDPGAAIAPCPIVRAIDCLPFDLLDFINHFLRSHQCEVNAESQRIVAEIIVARLLVAPIDHAALSAMVERHIVFVPPEHG
jgi:hypothetical protein